MFHMENTQLDSEVQFSEALRAFKQDTLKYAHTLDMTDSPKENLKISMLEVGFHVLYNQFYVLSNIQLSRDMIIEYKTGRARRCTNL